MRVLLLEDNMTRVRAFINRFLDNGWTWTHCTTATDCIKQLANHFWNLVFLDHDLGGQEFVSGEHENTGSYVARWWNHNQYGYTNPNTRVVVHSFNPVGAQYMVDRIPGAVYMPGVWLESEYRAWWGEMRGNVA